MQVFSNEEISVSEKIRKQREALDEAYQELMDDDTLSERQKEDRMDSIKVLKAMAEADVLINPSESNPIAMEMGLTQEQEQAMLSEGKTIISACAGSGKTRVLSAKVANLLKEDNDVSPFNIIAVFFKKIS